MAAEFVTEEIDEFQPKSREYATGPRGPRPRSEAQKQWDEAFKHAYDTKGFIAAQVAPEDADAAKKRIISSARLFGLAVTEGEPRPGRVEGTVILSWKIRVPTPRAKKNETAEVPAETPEQ